MRPRATGMGNRRRRAVKALSVKQPWANMIASGRKTIETRRWSTKYRGPLLIISSRQPRIEPYGCAVAVARLKECRPMTRTDERDACCPVYSDAVAWVLEDVRPVAPMPARGSLGVFECRIEMDDLTFTTGKRLTGARASDGGGPSAGRGRGAQLGGSGTGLWRRGQGPPKPPGAGPGRPRRR